MFFIDIKHEFENCDVSSLSLGDKQKTYERILDIHCPEKFPIIIRLDGKNFSHRVKQWKLKKPFDERFHKCMLKTAEILFTELQLVDCIWTGSDEISIVINDYKKESSFLFNRRLNKILSLSASIASVAFNFEAIKQKIDVLNFPAVFDSRITILPNEDEIYRNLIFRQNDCIRNSISQYARRYYSTKQLHAIGRDEQLKMIKEKGFDWDKDAPDWSKYGSYLFKTYVLYDLKTKKPIKTSKEPIEIFDEKTQYVRTKIEHTENKLV